MNTRLWWILGFILLLIIVIPSFLAESITDWMWFDSQNLDEVYTTRLWLGIGVFIVAAIVAAIFCAVNWMIAWRVSLPTTVFPGQEEAISRGMARSLTIAASIVAGVFLGFTGLAPMPEGIPGAGEVEVGWRLAREAWGRGYATEAARAALEFAFGDLGLDSVNSITAVVNLPSRAVMERLGMTQVDEFEHPRVALGSAIRPHVRYRIGSGHSSAR